MHYYKRIRELREARGMTQREIGEKLKMPQTQYIRYEKGDRDTPSEVLIGIADIYETSVDYLLGRTDKEKPYPKAKDEL